ncbi:MAG: sulfatase [Myxococcaceae bacterium]|nr:sulfatase [Myxococcaceae bacterium]
MERPSFRQLVLVQGVLCALAWGASVVSFVSQSSGVAERFAALARGPYLSFAVFAQLRVLPAYACIALVLALLVRPWLRTSAGWRTWLTVVALDVLVLLVALGPALWLSPGFFDSVERKLRVDLSLVERVHGLELLTVAFLALVAVAFASLVRQRRWRVTGGLAVALVFAGARYEPSPPQARQLARPNVLILAADSWRYDRLGAHGATRGDLTPHLDAFAKTAIDFRNHHVATASTLESWTTLLSGQFPPRHGLRSMYPSKEEVAAVERNPDLLPKRLAALGYDTVVSSDWVGNHFDLVDYGFARRDVGPVQNFEALLLEATMRAHLLPALFFSAAPGAVGDLLIPGRASLAWAARPEVLTERLFDGIDESVSAGRPFFGVLFASPTHLPYNARRPFNRRYTAADYEGPHRYQVEVRAHELITTGFSPTVPPDVIQHIRDLYDGAVADFDDVVGGVLRGLEARGLADTIVIITSDHGEDLYEPGSTLGHGTNFFGGDQSTRVPFLVRLPSRSARSIDAITRNADVAPTVLSLLGEAPPASMQGVDLTPLVRGETDDLDLTAFAETCYLFFPKARAMTGLSDAERAEVVDLAGATDTLEVDPTFRHNLVLRPSFRQAVIDAKDRMVRTSKWKLVVIPGKQRELVRLYDMEVDPAQRVDLSGRGLAAEVALRAMLEAYWR